MRARVLQQEEKERCERSVAPAPPSTPAELGTRRVTRARHFCDTLCRNASCAARARPGAEQRGVRFAAARSVLHRSSSAAPRTEVEREVDNRVVGGVGIARRRVERHSRLEEAARERARRGGGRAQNQRCHSRERRHCTTREGGAATRTRGRSRRDVRFEICGTKLSQNHARKLIQACLAASRAPSALTRPQRPPAIPPAPPSSRPLRALRRPPRPRPAATRPPPARRAARRCPRTRPPHLSFR